MTEQVADIVANIQALIRPDYRRRLRARGGARAMTWRKGVLPPGSATFGLALTEELESYAFGLLRTCLKALENDVREQFVFRGFELAAESLEAIVRNGDPQNELRGFFRIVAASSYHLGGYSARAYSLISQVQGDQNTSIIEDALALLIMRRLDLLRDKAIRYVVKQQNVQGESLGKDSEMEGTDDIDTILLEVATENYFRALSAFIFAIQDENEQWMQRSIQRVKDGERLCFERGLITTWWIYRITRFLIGDLWNHSIQKLLPHDNDPRSEWSRLRELFVASLIKRGTSEVDLWPSQLEIATRVMNDSDNIVASLPTSAGKTRIAEICILKALSKGQRVVFVTPLRALSAQTERTLRSTFAPLGFTVSSLYGAAGASTTDVNNLRTRHIVVGTPEKLDFALRNDPELLNDVGLVVFDEGHMLGPTEREIRYELLIQRLLRRQDGDNRRIVCLSAMLPTSEALDDFVSWIRQDRPGSALSSEWRPTQQRFGQISWAGNAARYEIAIEGESAYINRFIAGQVHIGPRGGRKHFPADRNDLAVASAWRLVEEGLSVLIYCPQKVSAKAVAKRVLAALDGKWISQLPRFDREKVQSALRVGVEWLGADSTPVRCLENGVALHYAGLPKPYLREIDLLIHEKRVPIVVASPTLARGLNISASCVLFQDFQRYTGQEWKPLSPEEFANVAGRAGRAFVDVDGQVLGICFTAQHGHQWQRLVDKHTERSLESGLVQLIAVLLNLFARKIPSGVDVIEYVLNNSSVWTTPNWEPEELEPWSRTLAILDIALISLIGDEECDSSNVAIVLDKLLSSSLFRRRLARLNEKATEFAEALLRSRAVHICENSSVQQRRGYFFAGLGFSAGSQLDQQAQILDPLIDAAEQALVISDTNAFKMYIISVAEVVFTIDAFTPNHLPPNWKEITSEWLDASAMSTILAIDDSAAEFIEDALVYKLTWAIEALRVRRKAFDENALVANSTAITSLIETGTRTIQQAILVQYGLSSRVAALKVLAAFPSDFDSLRTMRRWLRRKELLEKTTSDREWPTTESRDTWLAFLDLHKPKREVTLQEKLVQVEIDTRGAGTKASVADDLIAVPSQDESKIIILTPDLDVIGTVQPSQLPISWSHALGIAIGENNVIFSSIE